MIEGPNQPFKAVHDDVEKFFFSTTTCKNVNPLKVMAIIVKESMGIAFWCECDALAKANLSIMETTTGVSRDDFINFNRVAFGLNKGKFPKFRFEPSWFNIMKKGTNYLDWDRILVVSMACSWGVGQKGALFKFEHLPRGIAQNGLKAFQADVQSQIQQVFVDLHNLDPNNLKPFDLLATQYNAGASVKIVNKYGHDADDLFNTLQKSYNEAK